MTFEGVQYERQSKNNSTSQRLLYNAAMVKGGNVMLLVKNTSFLPDSGSLNFTLPLLISPIELRSHPGQQHAAGQMAGTGQKFLENHCEWARCRFPRTALEEEIHGTAESCPSAQSTASQWKFLAACNERLRRSHDSPATESLGLQVVGQPVIEIGDWSYASYNISN